MSKYKLICFCVSLGFFCGHAVAQTYVHIDSVAVRRDTSNKDTSQFKVKPHRDPHKATVRSAMIPGWGQIYNHQYWKAPIAWGGLAACIIIFRSNIQNYNYWRHVYSVVSAVEGNPPDSALYHTIDTTLYQYGLTSIQYIRNAYRQYVDYSVVAFILVWGLNVIDATVDAHLHEFDVTDNLSLQINPASRLTDGVNGISLVLDIHKARHRLSPLLTNHVFQ
jgi:hypothetical protein